MFKKKILSDKNNARISESKRSFPIRIRKILENNILLLKNSKVDTLDSTYFLVQDIKDFSTKMIDTGNSLFKQLDHFRKEKINQFKVIFFFSSV